MVWGFFTSEFFCGGLPGKQIIKTNKIPQMIIQFFWLIDSYYLSFKFEKNCCVEKILIPCRTYFFIGRIFASMSYKLHHCVSGFLLRLLLPVCTLFISSYTRQNSDIKLINASCEIRNNGINRTKASSARSEYYFKIKILSKEKVTFDSLWMNGASFKTYLSANQKFISGKPVTFAVGDTITVRASETSKENRPKSNAPIRYKGAGLLRYYVNNEPFYLTIDNIKFNNSPNRP